MECPILFSAPPPPTFYFAPPPLSWCTQWPLRQTNATVPETAKTSKVNKMKRVVVPDCHCGGHVPVVYWKTRIGDGGSRIGDRNR